MLPKIPTSLLFLSAIPSSITQASPTPPHDSSYKMIDFFKDLVSTNWEPQQ